MALAKMPLENIMIFFKTNNFLTKKVLSNMRFRGENVLYVYSNICYSVILYYLYIKVYLNKKDMFFSKAI